MAPLRRGPFFYVLPLTISILWMNFPNLASTFLFLLKNILEPCSHFSQLCLNSLKFTRIFKKLSGQSHICLNSLRSVWYQNKSQFSQMVCYLGLQTGKYIVVRVVDEVSLLLVRAPLPLVLHPTEVGGTTFCHICSSLLLLLCPAGDKLFFFSFFT